jgi:REP element-mobilizing transposase RayT
VRELERTFAALREQRSDFRLAHYSIQKDHAHFIVEARDRDALARGMKALCARFARAVNRVLGRAGRVLRDRYHLHVLQTPREVRNALRYVLLNVRKHFPGWSSAIGYDPASSAAWFDSWRRSLEAGSRPSGPRPVSLPRTWLLAVGWRRHGLIDPADVPGTRDGPSRRSDRRPSR